MIKRYDFSDDEPYVHQDGDWVSHDDHIKEVERLKSEIKEGNELLQERKKQKDELYRKVGEMICENSELQAEVERLKGGIKQAINDLEISETGDCTARILRNLNKLIDPPEGV